MTPDARTPRQIHEDEQQDEAIREALLTGNWYTCTHEQTRAFVRVKALGPPDWTRAMEPDGPCDACLEEEPRPAEVSMVIDAFGTVLRIWLCRVCADIPDVLPVPENEPS